MFAPPFRLFFTGLVLCGVVACEPTEPSQNIFEPVQIADPTPEPMAASVPASDDLDPEWDVAEDANFVIDSSEMGSDQDDDAADEGVPVEPADEQAAIAPVSDDTPDQNKPSAAPPVATPTAAAPADGASAEGWPLRLVSTVHQAQPPRAILGLPDGRELVVTPGDILAEEKIVILAIGDGIIQVAEISPNGDHAEIASRTLTAQY